MTQKEKVRIIEIIKAAMASENFIETNVIQNITQMRTKRITELTEPELFTLLTYITDYERCHPVRLNIIDMLYEIPFFVIDYKTEKQRIKYEWLTEFLKRNGIKNEFYALLYAELIIVEDLITPFYENAIHSLSLCATESLLKELSIPVISTPRKKRINEKSNKRTTE